MDVFLKDGKSIILAYDQGLEHGPSADFDNRNVDPSFIVEIASKGGFNGIALQKGVAEKYYDGKVPLIVKVNGKSSLSKGEPDREAELLRRVRRLARRQGDRVHDIPGERIRGGDVHGVRQDPGGGPRERASRRSRGSIRGAPRCRTTLRRR